MTWRISKSYYSFLLVIAANLAIGKKLPFMDKFNPLIDYLGSSIIVLMYLILFIIVTYSARLCVIFLKKKK